MLVFLLTSTCLSVVKSQSFETLVDAYIDDNAAAYLQPLADLVSANINTGIREWSRVDSNFHIRIGVITMASFPSKSMRTFMGKTGLGFEPEQEATVPTIVGKNEAVAVEGVNGTFFVFPVGYNVRQLPLAVPQITLCGIFNTELSGRYFAFDLNNDFGKVDYLGFGLRHGLNAYFKTLPFDLSLGYYYQKFNVGSYMQGQNQLISAYLGKSGKWWSSQISLAYQTSKTKFQYSFNEENNQKTYTVDVKGKYPVLVELSAALKLWLVNLHAAVSYNGPVTVSLGLGIKL